eukprot:11355279-Alexandrium_andersonii.AAC.1
MYDSGRLVYALLLLPRPPPPLSGRLLRAAAADYGFDCCAGPAASRVPLACAAAWCALAGHLV